jgi:hypothetical protein
VALYRSTRSSIFISNQRPLFTAIPYFSISSIFSISFIIFLSMAPRRQKKPVNVLNTQTIDFSATEDTIIIDPQLLHPESYPESYPESHPESHPELHPESHPESHPQSHPESHSLLPPTPSQPNTPSQPSTEDQLDRLEWTPKMIETLFTELLDQAQDGKRADSGFKKEAWDSVLREVRAVYTGPLTITLQKVKAKEQTFKGYYRDWKFLREQSGFGWDEETQIITASNQAWDDIIAVSYYPILYFNLI